MTASACPVLVDNDVNTLAAAERLYGVGREHSSYLVVTIGRGVGCGIVIDGAIYRGAAGGAGEIGHIPLSRGRPPLRLRRGGMSGGPHRLGRAVACGPRREGGRSARPADVVAEGGPRRGYGGTGGLRGGAGGCSAGHWRGSCTRVDPEVVVLMGEGVDAWEFWQPGFEPALRGCLLPARRELPVVVEPWSEDQWARGAASLVLASPFDSAGTGGEQGRMVRVRLGTRCAVTVPVTLPLNQQR